MALNFEKLPGTTLNFNLTMLNNEICHDNFKMLCIIYSFGVTNLLKFSIILFYDYFYNCSLFDIVEKIILLYHESSHQKEAPQSMGQETGECKYSTQ
jgi:hypothetical protein